MKIETALQYIAIPFIGIAAGLLGPFVVWKRMTLFGDCVSHASLLGLAIAAMFNSTNTTFAIMVSSLLISLILAKFNNKLTDTTLSITTNFMTAIGMLLLTLQSIPDEHILHSLFGDTLPTDIISFVKLICTSIVVIAVVYWRHQKWILATLSHELAVVELINAQRINVEFLVLLAIFITFTSQILGILLVTSFLILPVVIAQNLTKTPTSTMICASVISTIAGVVSEIIAQNTNVALGQLAMLINCAMLLITVTYKQIKK